MCLAAAELELERELSDMPTVQALRAQAQRSATARLAQLTGASHRRSGSTSSENGNGNGGGGGTPETMQRLRDAAECGSPLLDEERAASPRSPGAAWGSLPDGHGGGGRFYGGDDDDSSDSGRATMGRSTCARSSTLSLGFSYTEPGGVLSVHERQVRARRHQLSIRND